MTGHFDLPHAEKQLPEDTTHPRINPRVRGVLLALTAGMMALCVVGLAISHVL
jgi:hypothetical protein